jgi:diguanylate cyclase
VTVATPAQIAKGALRRLALAQQEPTPDNYARAYAEESGQAAAVLPDRARPLLERLVARADNEPTRRDDIVNAFMQGRWDLAGQKLDDGALSAAAQAEAWAARVERLVRALQRGGRHWSVARKKDSLQRVLDGSRSDLQRLQQRLGALLGAWESDTPLAPEEGQGPGTPALTDEPAAQSGPSTEGGVGSEPGSWPAAIAPLRLTVNAGLPGGDPRAAELADQLALLADRLVADGPAADCLRSLELTCNDIRRLYAHRHHLVDQLERLCHELGRGLVELAEDESWAQGQAKNLEAWLAEGLNSRSVRAASGILAETRHHQARVRSVRDEARNALKHLIHRLLDEIGELGAHTGRFQDSLDRHVQAIEGAQSIEGLAGVVRELVDDSRAVRDLVHQARQRMAAESARAQALESQVRALEGELRKLSDEVCTDALTQVANRRGLMRAFATESARSEREGPGAPLSVGLIDIDNFKKLNDALGHAAGDQALLALSAAVRDSLRPVDHLARFGGEEFVVLLPATPCSDAQRVLTRLQRSLSAALFMHDDKEVFVTFSAGVTQWRPGEPLEAALERADEALYEAKRTGKNRTCAA